MISTPAIANTQPAYVISVRKQLAQVQKKYHVKIGMYAIDTNSGKVVGYHANSLFPIQSTFKVVGAALLLKKSERNPKLLSGKIHYSKKQLTFWSPITSKHLQSGMTLKALAGAAVSYSDNTAINLIMNKLGGAKAITRFAHKLGNASFNLEHDEPNLNSNPNNSDDSSTPKDMALLLQKLTLGNALWPTKRKLLITWMRNNTTGNKRIRAGAPIGWVVADKTGSGGNYGIANDIAVVWPPACKPIILTIYTVKKSANSQRSELAVAQTAHIVLNAFARMDACLKR